MTTWFLAFLALIWFAFFLPGAQRARRQTPLAAAARFKRAMSRVAPPKAQPRHRAPRRPQRERSQAAAHKARTDSGRWIIVPDPSRARAVAHRRAQTRRRRLLACLLGGVVASAGVALWRGGSWLELHLIADGALVFYVALLFESKRRRDERATKVIKLDDEGLDDFRVMDPVEVGGRRS